MLRVYTHSRMYSYLPVAGESDSMDAAASTETETDYDYGVCTLMPEANRRPSRYTGVCST